MQYFLHPAMLLALAAATIPLIIELLFRRRRRRIELPSIRYLLADQAHKKVKRQDRLLLILRCIVPAVLAAALARPLLSPHGSADTSRHVVIVLDDTLSMGQQVGVSTALALAKTKASRLLSLLPQGTKVTLVTAGQRVDRRSDRDENRYALGEMVNNLKVSHGAATMAETAEQLAAWLEQDPTPRATREIFIFSDFQKTTWLRKAPDGAESAGVLRKLQDVASVNLVDVGGQRPFNYFFSELRPLEPLLVTGQTSRFVATVQAKGTPTAEQGRASVTFLVNGQKQGMAEVPLKTGAASVQFDYRFNQPGEYLVEVDVEGDSHRLDNQRYYLASVPAARRVLIVDEQAGTDSAESRLLAAAVAPHDEPGLDRSSIFAVKVVHPADIVRENLSDYDAAVVMGLEHVPEDLVNKLEPYVRDGGSLVLFLGPRTNCYEYNQKLFRDGAGILPARLEKWASVGASATSAPTSGPAPVGDSSVPLKLAAEYPGFAMFAAEPNFGAARIGGYMSLAEAPRGEVIGALSTGQPGVVAQSVGAGRVVAFCTSGGPPLASLPYPVMPQELLRYLGGNPDAAVNLDSGQTFRQDVMISAQHLILRKPDGTKVRLTPAKKEGSETLAVSFDGTDQKGLYEVDAQGGTGSAARGGLGSPVLRRGRFVVNLQPVECDLERLEENEAKQVLSDDLTWVRPQTPMESVVRGQYALAEMSGPLLWTLAALLATEMLLAWRFGRRRQ